jgi:hypothetical protein
MLDVTNYPPPVGAIFTGTAQRHTAGLLQEGRIQEGRFRPPDHQAQTVQYVYEGGLPSPLADRNLQLQQHSTSIQYHREGVLCKYRNRSCQRAVKFSAAG